MRRRQFLTLLAPVVLAACADAPLPTPGDSSEIENLPPDEPVKLAPPTGDERTKHAAANNAFAFELYGKVAKPGNLALSPFSISTALTMAWAGARRETAAEMQKVLHVDGAREQILTASGKVSAALQKADQPFKLRVANRLFGEKTATFEQPFLDEMKSSFGAPLAPMDFKHRAGDETKVINGWVEQQTEKRIKNVIPEGQLNDLTKLVLVNAIYFLADWESPFKKESTRDDTFKPSSTVSRSVPTMRQESGFKYAEKDGAKVLEMPYVGGKTSMVLVLPNDVDGIGKLESSMNAASFQALRESARETKVNVTLPKFEIDPAAPMGLVDALSSLGMKLAFDRDNADLTGIAKFSAPEDRLSIAKIFHKAFVKVDEKGTEAAAATAIAVGTAGAAPIPAPLPEFHADHPFLFFIIDSSTGLILFMGRVEDPSKP